MFVELKRTEASREMAVLSGQRRGGQDGHLGGEYQNRVDETFAREPARSNTAIRHEGDRRVVGKYDTGMPEKETAPRPKPGHRGNGNQTAIPVIPFPVAASRERPDR